MLLPIDKIFIDSLRQRRDIGDISGLVASISAVGLINPVLVDETETGYNLVAGERRLTACKKLGMAEIPVTIRVKLSSRDRTRIELHENIRRKDLSWQEEAKAVASYAKIEATTHENLAASLGYSHSTISKMIKVAEGLIALPMIDKCPTWSGAYDLYTSYQKKTLDSQMETLLEIPEESFPLVAAATRVFNPGDAPAGYEASGEIVPAGTRLYGSETRKLEKPKPINFSAVTSDFTDWAEKYRGRRFNLIHLDPPYGVGMSDNDMMNSNPTELGKHYPDSPEIFLSILNSLLQNQDKLVSETAHLICWLTPGMFGKAFGKFTHYGWKCSNYPLIWHKSDNSGILPDPRRLPRRTYEMALFASRGDRNLVKAKAASFASPISKEVHVSEKPKLVLEHFLSMIVDSTTEIFDPTCGSGNAILVAKALGAAKGLGIDINEEYVAHVNKELSK